LVGLEDEKWGESTILGLFRVFRAPDQDFGIFGIMGFFGDLQDFPSVK